jgi:Na+/H+-dicarboxylate symporter
VGARIAGIVTDQSLQASGGPVSRWWGELGELLLVRPFLLVTIPIVFVSVCLGVASIGDVRSLGRLGGGNGWRFAWSLRLPASGSRGFPRPDS